MANPTNLSLLESLPRDLRVDILSRVAASSREDIRSCLTVSKLILSSVHDDRVFSRLNLRPQAMAPLVTYGLHHQLMEKCLRSNNPIAHFIEGVKLYFVEEDDTMGLYHLRKSAEGLYDNGTYLYAILLLFRGNRLQGRMFLRTLGWEASKRRADRCWREIRVSLRFVIIPMKHEYGVSLDMNTPPANCHLNDLETRCRHCYIYKQMMKFFESIPQNHF